MQGKLNEKKFCINGHEFAVVGKNKWGRCRECIKINNRKRHPLHPRIKVQLCVNGHDISIVGRNKNNRACNGCIKPVSLGLRLRKKKQFCIYGHNILEVGRAKNGKCNGCQKAKHPGKSKQRFCKKGHDKTIVGQNKHGRCTKCSIEYHREWNKKNREHIREVAKKYDETHRNEQRRYERNKIITDINYKLRVRLRDRIIKAIKRGWKAGSAVKDLGCTIEFFKQYLESKFTKEMTWNNWGEVWELDHIIPLWKFDLTNREQFLQAANYTNMQPLTITEHTEKTTREQIEREELKRKKH